MRIQQLTEQPRRAAVIAFGRMNPPTIGHAKLVDAVKSQAGDPYIFLSQSQKPKTDPLSFEQKIGFAKAFFPGVTVGDPEVRTIFDALNKIYAMGYTDLVYVAGSDRVQQFTDLINKYNGQEDFYSFDSIQVVSAGERDPDAEGAEGMSASKMRAAATAGDFEAFKSGTPNPDMAQSMYDAVRTGMGMMENLERIVTVLETLVALNNVKPLNENVIRATGIVLEAWSEKYKRSINCNNPKGFSQRAHCQGRKKTEDIEELDEGWWEDLQAKAKQYWDQLTGNRAQASIPPAKMQDYQTRYNNWLQTQIPLYAKAAGIGPQLLRDRLKAESNLQHWGATAPGGSSKPDPNKITRGDLGLKDQAIGIGQIRKPALDDVNKEFGMKIKPKDLENANTNLYVSSRYLAMLRNKYYKKFGKDLTDDPDAYAYVAYRYGPKVPDSAKKEIEDYIASKKKKEGVNEAFDTKIEWIKELGPSGSTVYATKVGDAYIELTYRPVSKGVYISFTRGGVMSVTGEGSQNKIFGAVINHIKQWAAKNKPEQIMFSAFKPRTGAFGSQDSTRSGLYRKMVQRFANQNGYEYDVEDTGNEDTFILKRQGVTEGKSPHKKGTKKYKAHMAAMHAGMNESYKLQLERDDDLLVLHIKDTKTGKRTEVRGKPNYEGDGYDSDDKLHQLLDKIGKAANMSELMNGEVVSINPRHPDGPEAKERVKKVVGEAGVGRITKQNATKDAPIGSEFANVKKLGLGSGKPKELHAKARKNSDPNTLFNLGLAEGQLNEKGSIGIPLSSGMTVVIAPHRPLKVKKSKKKVKMVGAGEEE